MTWSVRYRKVPSERPHPCNRPPPVFFPSERLGIVQAPPAPEALGMAIMSVHAQSINGAIFCRSTEIRSCFVKMSQKKRQSSYTVEYKLGLLCWYQDNSENKHATTRNFGIDRKRLREWLEKADRLRDNRVGAAKKKRKLNAGKEPLSLDRA